MSIEILYADLPITVQNNFQEVCGWQDDDTSFEYCQETEKNELIKFNATINQTTDRITFENEAYLNWFILRYS